MYSKNDYRYYLEHRLMMSDNFLAHYGVKGMKWKKHIGNSIDSKLANRAVKLGYERSGTYYANTNKNGQYVTINKNNKDLAYNYLYDRGEHAKSKVNKKIKKIKNKKVRGAASKAAKKTYNAYTKHVVKKAEKRAYDSHNLTERDGRVYVKSGKKAR